jgi:hypothetical protein
MNNSKSNTSTTVFIRDSLVTNRVVFMLYHAYFHHAHLCYSVNKISRNIIQYLGSTVQYNMFTCREMARSSVFCIYSMHCISKQMSMCVVEYVEVALALKPCQNKEMSTVYKSSYFGCAMYNNFI